MTHLRAYVSPLLAGLVILALIGLSFALVSGALVASSIAERRTLTFVIGASFCLSLLILAPRSAGLARLGGYSYTIYLFHVFFTAASFEFLSWAAPGMPTALVWVTGVLVGLSGPVALHYAILRNMALSTLLLGLKPRIGAVAQTPLAQRA